ncbi:MAG: DUF1624 domain-containing protein [Chloroflexaceae bacterium]|nr:DUF1624 domain-containing protein [Chloroflexaceae bacterium]NJO06922.1 DUF1624 domain-containing protein [Chloroflexaceae bacterium]
MVSSRRWEVDALRGFAVVLMVIYHCIWDLAFFGIAPINIAALPWQAFARFIGTLFLFVLGVSLWLRRVRFGTVWPWALQRGGVLLGLGMLISLTTFLFVGDSYVRFGMLHLLGTALVLSALALRAPRLVVVAVALLGIGIGAYLNTESVPYAWLIWLGLAQRGVAMVDYYPLLPWGCIALLGTVVARTIYPDAQARLPLPNIADTPLVWVLRWLGRYALPIYFLHQPILIGILVAYQALAGSG